MRLEKNRFCTRGEARVTSSASYPVSTAKRLSLVPKKTSTFESLLTGKPMLESVRIRLTLWYAAVLACTLLVLFLATYWIVRQSLLSRKDASLVALSDSFLVTFNDELL